MVHSGYEATAVDYTFGSFKGFFDTIKATLLGFAAGAVRKNLKTRKVGYTPHVEFVEEDKEPVGAGAGCATPSCGSGGSEFDV